VSENIAGIGLTDDGASVWVTGPCYGRKRSQLHVSPHTGSHWCVSLTEKQARVLLMTLRKMAERRTAIVPVVFREV
jgi:hypothetical protein